MALAVGASRRRAVAGGRAGGRAGGARGAEDVTARGARSRTCSRARGGPAQGARADGHQHGSRRTSAASCSRSWSCTDEVVARCFPAAPALAGRVSFATIAERQLAPPRGQPPTPPARERASRPGLRALPRRWRAPPVRASDRQGDAGARRAAGPGIGRGAGRATARRSRRDARDRPRPARAGAGAASRCRIDRGRARRAILRRFVGAAMSLGALSPEAHQALTIGHAAARAAPQQRRGRRGPRPGTTTVRRRPP